MAGPRDPRLRQFLEQWPTAFADALAAAFEQQGDAWGDQDCLVVAISLAWGHEIEQVRLVLASSMKQGPEWDAVSRANPMRWGRDRLDGDHDDSAQRLSDLITEANDAWDVDTTSKSSWIKYLTQAIVQALSQPQVRAAAQHQGVDPVFLIVDDRENQRLLTWVLDGTIAACNPGRDDELYRSLFGDLERWASAVLKPKPKRPKAPPKAERRQWVEDWVQRMVPITAQLVRDNAETLRGHDVTGAAFLTADLISAVQFAVGSTQWLAERGDDAAQNAWAFPTEWGDHHLNELVDTEAARAFGEGMAEVTAFGENHAIVWDRWAEEVLPAMDRILGADEVRAAFADLGFTPWFVVADTDGADEPVISSLKRLNSDRPELLAELLTCWGAASA